MLNVFGPHRFRHVVIKSGVKRDLTIAFLSPPGDRNQRRSLSGWSLADGTDDLEAGNPRHADIEQRGIGFHPRKGLERLHSVVGDVNLIPFETQQFGQTVRRVHIVVRDQNSVIESHASSDRG